MKKVLTILICMAMSLSLNAQQMVLSKKEIAKLQSTEITDMSMTRLKLHYPRYVGWNSKRGPHGDGPTVNFLILNAGDIEGVGAHEGWRKINMNNLDQFRPEIVGKKVADFLDPQTFLVKPEYRYIDVAIYDLVGVVLNKPFYKLFGKPAAKKVACYSGMIYFDDLVVENGVGRAIDNGIQELLDNCQWDYDFGYRQLKMKIGRGKNWMPHDEGMARDIQIIKTIHERFPDVTILVDPNNGYTVQDCIDFIEGIKPATIYWMEEPFDENVKDYAEFDAWRKKNAPEIITIDGEDMPKKALCLELGKEGYLDAYCEDILGLGFTEWIELMPTLRELGMIASPHAWGTVTKSIYAAQFALAFGSIPTVEGVTCFSDDVELNYTVKNGYYVPSKAPGFGMHFCHTEKSR